MSPGYGMQSTEFSCGRLDTMDALHDDCQDWLESCLTTDQKCDTEDITDDLDNSCHDNSSADDRKGAYARLRSATKSHSTPQTLKWLDDNYEIAEGVCIPRSTLYVHYLDYCERNDTQPVNAASFGKIIRQQFPQLTTRRLGTRGQSKYHYYGIGVRESSRYYEVGFSAKGAQSSVDGKKDTSKQIIAYSPRSKLGTLLPEFPDMKDVKLPTGVTEEKVLTFLMMYRTHCQRILDTVIRANFEEVQSFLLHFWQGMPPHIKSILESRTLVILVGVCDSILYKAIANVLMPTVLQPLPESLTQVIRNFSVQLDGWLHQAMDSLPESLQRVKFDLARRFSQVLNRQTSLNHLCQAARTVINSAEMTSQMLDDWYNVDLNSIIKQTLYTMEGNNKNENIVIVKLARDFEILLEDQAPLESYIEWLDAMIEQCVNQKCLQQNDNTPRVARQFLLMWSCVGTRVIRDMTLHSAPSFGSFHLLHLMFDEYVLYCVENIHNQDRANELHSALKGDIPSDFIDDISSNQQNQSASLGRSEAILADTQRMSVIRCPETSFLTNDNNDVPVYISHVDTPSFQQSMELSMCHSTQTLKSSTSTGQMYSNPGLRLRSHNISSTLYNPYSPHVPDVCLSANTGCISSSDFNNWPEGHISSPVEANRQYIEPSAHLHQGCGSQVTPPLRSQRQHISQCFDYYNEQLDFKRMTGPSQSFVRKCADDIQDANGRGSVSDLYFHSLTH